MPIYLINTPNGKRLVEAQNQKQAINYALRVDVTAQNLNAVELANVLRHENIELETAIVTNKEEAATEQTAPLE